MGQTAKVHDQERAADTRQGVTAYTSDGSIRDIPVEDGPFDEFYISPEQKEEYKIEDNEVCFWARDPEYWQAHGELVNRVDQLRADPRRGGMGGRLVRTEEFDKIHIGGGTSGDLVLMAIPREISDRQQSEIDAASGQYEKDLRRTSEGMRSSKEYGPDEDENWRANLQHRMEAEHEYHKQVGLISSNSPTAGLGYAEALVKMRPRSEEVEERQAALRSGGQHTPVTQENFARLMTGQKRLHGMGDSGLGKTLRQKVGKSEGAK